MKEAKIENSGRHGINVYANPGGLVEGADFSSTRISSSGLSGLVVETHNGAFSNINLEGLQVSDSGEFGAVIAATEGRISGVDGSGLLILRSGWDGLRIHADQAGAIEASILTTRKSQIPAAKELLSMPIREAKLPDLDLSGAYIARSGLTGLYSQR